MSSQQWIVRPRDYELDIVKYQAKLTPVQSDPLNAEEIKLSTKKKLVKKGNITMKTTTLNPLEQKITINTQAIGNSNKVTLQTNPTQKRVSTYTKYILPSKPSQFSLVNSTADSVDSNWSSLKRNLIDTFCKDSNMEVKSIYTITLDEEEIKTYKIDQGRNRLEEIEGADKKQTKFNIISSGEYVAKMEVLKREMLQKWEAEDKVGALKIIIHCTKMLNDVFTPKFYTHKFLITIDILDVFAKLIYDRMIKLSFSGSNNTDFNDINPSIINATAKDICLNWILKCSCIRELLPRIYIDILFLRVFKFIYSEKEIELKILSIAKMIRGISHPLINFYVSMYFAKVALTYYPKYKSFLLVIIDNYSKFAIREDTVKKLNYDNITLVELKKILEPCVEWVVFLLSKSMTAKQYNNIMKIYDDSKSVFLIRSLINNAPVKFIFNPEYIDYIFACSELYGAEDKVPLYILILNRVISTNNPIENKYILLIWDKIKQSNTQTVFIDCALILGEIVIKYYPDEIQDKFFEEVFDIFKKTISKTNLSNTEDMAYYHKFEGFLYSILTKINNYSNILNVDNFLYLLENFQPEIKLNICHTILTQINDRIKDTYLAFSLLKIGKYIHDSIETDSSTDRMKEAAEILTNFIKKVDFGIDYENYLNFLTEARGLYTDIEEVTELLITEVQRLCVQTYKIVKGKHNKKTLRFCKVCIAYCQITIPSFRNSQTQVKLLFETAQIALANNLISECDSLLKNIITLLSKIITEAVTPSQIEHMNDFFKSFSSFLVVVPSNPESPFQLVSGIMNIFSNSESASNNTLKLKMSFNVSIVKYLITQLQNKLPYHVSNVDSNDEIFVADDAFRSEATGLIDKIVSEVLADVSDYNTRLNNYDYEDYDYLTHFCLISADCFSREFERTKYSNSVTTKLIELATNYVEILRKNNSMKNKVEFYNNFINKLNI